MRNRVAAAAALGVLLLAGCAQPAATTTPASTTVSSTPSPTKTAIQEALARCGMPETYLPLEDSGHTVTLHWGLSSDKLSASDVSCILHSTGMPSSVGAKIDATRALDGMQHDSWGAMKATWTFHPDNGANLILTDNP